MIQDEQVGRADAKHNERMPMDPVAEPPPSRPRKVLMQSQRIDVADSTALEIARCRVVACLRRQQS
jgi:hypothetical protein